MPAHLLANSMATPSCNFDLQVVEFLMSSSTLQLREQVEASASAVGSWSAGIAAAGISLYATMWVVNWARGGSGGTVMEFVVWWARAMVFTAIAGSAAYYNSFVTDVFWQAPAQIAQVVVQGKFAASDIKMDAEGKLQLGNALDQAATKGICTGTNLWKATSSWAPVDSLGYWLAGLFVIVGVVIFVAVTAGLTFIGYASLAIVLSLGPLFLIAGIWDATRPMFESFMRTAINYALYGIVLMIVVGLTLGLINSFSTSSLSQGGGTIADAISLAIRSMVVFAIGTAMLFKADDISSSLAGGVSIGAAGLAAKAAAITASPAKAALKAAQIAANPGKAMGEFTGGTFHRDPRTGRMAYRSRSENAGEYQGALTNARKKNGIRRNP